MSKQGWTYKKLGDYVIEYSVKNKTKEDIPVYSVTNSQGFCKEYFSKEVASQDKSTYKIVPFGFFAYNPSRINVGSIDWQRVEEKVIVSPLYNVFGVSENLLQSYLLYFLKSPITLDYINKIATGTVRLNLKFSMLKEFSLPVPPVAEQERIVEELDLLSGIIEKKKEQLKAYDQLAQSIFYTMFGDPITNEKGWQVKKMEALCDRIVDCPHSTPKKVDYVTQYPCIRTSELKGGTVQWETMQYLDECEYNKRITRLKPIAGDIVFGREGSIGDAVILPKGYHFSLGQRTMLLRANFRLISNVFLHRTILSEWVKRQIDAVNVSSTVAHVNIKDFKLFDIPVPPHPLQQEFAAKVEAIEQQKALVQQSIAEVQTLFDSRMDYWFG